MTKITQIIDAQYDVAAGKTSDGKPLRVLVLAEPVSGEQFHVPLLEDNAQELGAMLQGKQPADLVVAQPGAVPPHPNAA